MNLLAVYSSDLDQLCTRTCLTLLHSLWEFGLLAAGAACLTRFLAARHPERGYAIHVAALLLGLTAIPVTFALVHPRQNATWVEVEPASADQPALLMRAADLRGDSSTDRIELALAESPAKVEVPLPSTPHAAFPWLELARWLSLSYAVGVLLMLARLSWSIWRCQRLTSRCQLITTGPLAELVQALAKQWSLNVVPHLALSEGTVVPQLVGLLRPTILLPASAVTGLTSSELEMILAHELAHVRRWDMWINLLQRLAEAVLFFNPAVWYLSHRISTLREYCCDEQTCRTNPNEPIETRLRYAQALLRVVELSGATHDVTGLAGLAASGRNPSEIRRRVARLFGEPLREPIRVSRGGLLAMAVCLLILLVGPLTWQTSAEDTDTSQDQEEEIKTDSNTDLHGFQYGGKVDIVAIGTHGEEPQRWWDAAGNNLESVPFNWTPEGNTVDAGDKLWRRVVLRVDTQASGGDHTDVKWRILGSSSATGGILEFTGSVEPGKYLTRYFSLDKNANSFGLRVGITKGDWKTVVKSEPRSIGSVTGLAGGKSVLFSDAFFSNQGTVTVVSHNYFDQAFRVLAFDKQGKMHRSVYGGGNSSGAIYQSRPTFPGIRPEEIDHFEFQIRDYEWVEINDLPVVPEDTRTSVGLDYALEMLSQLAESDSSGLQAIFATEASQLPANLRAFARLGTVTQFTMKDKPSFWQSASERIDHEAGFAGAFKGIREGLLLDPYGPKVDLKSIYEQNLGDSFLIVSGQSDPNERRRRLLAWSLHTPREIAQALERMATADKQTKQTMIQGLPAYYSDADGVTFCLVDNLLLVAESRTLLLRTIALLKPPAPEESFSLAPVTTELQRRLLNNDKAVAYLRINGEVFRTNDGKFLNFDSEVTDTITARLMEYTQEKKDGLLFMQVDFGSAESNSFHEQLQLWGAELMLRTGGFSKACKVNCTFHNNPNYSWKKFEPDEEEVDISEPAVIADDFRIYAVRTALSRFLSGGVDCLIESSEPLSARKTDIFSALEEVLIRQTLEQMNFEKHGLARVNVQLEPPAGERPSGLVERQQKNSPFHRLAVEVLQDAGFAEVILDVNVNSVHATSRYGPTGETNSTKSEVSPKAAALRQLVESYQALHDKKQLSEGELISAQAELAEAEGDLAAELKYRERIVELAKEENDVLKVLFDAGRTPLDLVVKASARLAEAEQSLAQTKKQMGIETNDPQPTDSIPELDRKQNRVVDKKPATTKLRADRTANEVATAKIESLRDLVKTYEAYYKRIKDLKGIGTQGGEADKATMTLFSLETARADLAAAEGRAVDVVKHREAAVDAGQQMVMVLETLYDAGKTPVDLLLNASAELAQAKQALAEAKSTVAEAKNSEAKSATPGETAAKQTTDTSLAAETDLKIAALKELVETYKQLYEQAEILHKNGDEAGANVLLARYKLTEAQAQLAAAEGDFPKAKNLRQEAIAVAEQRVEFVNVAFRSGNATLAELLEAKAEVAKAKIALAEDRGLDPVQEGLQFLQQERSHKPDKEAQDPEPTSVLEEKQMLIRVVDSDDNPLEGVDVFRNHVLVKPGYDRHVIENKHYPTDAKGEAVLSFLGENHDLRIWVRKDGYIPLHAMWAVDIHSDAEELPKEYEFRMEHGTTIGGIVRDREGNPIQGARVEVCNATAMRPMLMSEMNQRGRRPVPVHYLAEGESAVTTDADGRWSLSNVPADGDLVFDNQQLLRNPVDRPLQLRVSHPEFTTFDAQQLKSGYAEKITNPSLSQLRNKSAEIVLHAADTSASIFQESDPSHPAITPFPE